MPAAACLLAGSRRRTARSTRPGATMQPLASMVRVGTKYAAGLTQTGFDGDDAACGHGHVAEFVTARGGVDDPATADEDFSWLILNVFKSFWAL